LNVSWVDAGISKPVEHGSWNSISIRVGFELSSLFLYLSKLIEGGIVVLTVLLGFILFEF
jgi:hypothetical protein